MPIRTTRLIVPILLLASPAIANGVDTAGPEVAGKMLFEENCVECHGEDAKEGASGDIRDADLQQVRRAVRGTDAMPEFEFESEEIAALVAYLETL